ncbi:hypothetical protein [Polaribacter sargassicola]|uniref:hypothetical protein n=1 Tax=Polaribacter sargassicola TaxID=2836891 RepID=UPI001F27755A|nr:hypothetical protein [Polaribacter sp. DS7-9]MCG1035718.1 hypothetical protein [Polaribacter sp. DS7-9]
MSDLDFTQIEDYTASQEITTSLIYFTLLPNHFINESGAIQSVKTDVTDFEGFQNDYIKDNIVEATFYVEIKNEFDTSFSIQFDFLDDNNNVTYSITRLEIASNQLDYTFEENVIINNHPNIKNTTKIRTTVVVNNSTVLLTSNETNELEFKSASKIYLVTGD